MIEGRMQVTRYDKNDSEVNKNITYVKLDSIRMNPQQPKRQYSKTSLEQLSESIKEFGIVNPINIRKISTNFYEIVTGERIFRAASLAGVKEIPVTIIQSDEEAAILSLIETIEDNEMSYLEEAESYNSLLNKYNFTQEELAKRIGKSQSTIANKIRLLKLPPIVKKILCDNNLTERHARALLKLNDEQLQLKVLKFVCEKNLNVKKTEELIKKAINKFVASNGKKSSDNNSIGSIKNIRTFVGTLKNAIDVMKRSGVDVKVAKVDKGSYVDFIVRIPKDK